MLEFIVYLSTRRCQAMRRRPDERSVPLAKSWIHTLVDPKNLSSENCYVYVNQRYYHSHLIKLNYYASILSTLKAMETILVWQSNHSPQVPRRHPHKRATLPDHQPGASKRQEAAAQSHPPRTGMRRRKQFDWSVMFRDFVGHPQSLDWESIARTSFVAQFFGN